MSAVSAAVRSAQLISVPTSQAGSQETAVSARPARPAAPARLRLPSRNQTAVPATKLTRFCPTWIKMLFTSVTRLPYPHHSVALLRNIQNFRSVLLVKCCGPSERYACAGGILPRTPVVMVSVFTPDRTSRSAPL